MPELLSPSDDFKQYEINSFVEEICPSKLIKIVSKHIFSKNNAFFKRIAFFNQPALQTGSIYDQVFNAVFKASTDLNSGIFGLLNCCLEAINQQDPNSENATIQFFHPFILTAKIYLQQKKIELKLKCLNYGCAITELLAFSMLGLLLLNSQYLFLANAFTISNPYSVAFCLSLIVVPLAIFIIFKITLMKQPNVLSEQQVPLLEDVTAEKGKLANNHHNITKLLKNVSIFQLPAQRI